MTESINPDIFARNRDGGLLIDVRSPGEFASGHIVGAVNMPLFSDEERAEVGTFYHRQGKEPAVMRGLEIVGPRIAGMARTATGLAAGDLVTVYCWRGGMRSESVCWLLGTAGLKVRRIRGGYKAYRALIEPLAGALKRLIVLSGPTGSGKSDILHELERRGEQVLDLEGLARHKGSAFGGLTGPQESCEMFVNRLIDKLSSFDPGKRVWCEGESRSIGRVTIPEALWETMRGACSVYIDAPVDRRMERIMAEYGDIDPQALKGAFDRITKRLGLEKTLQAKDAVDSGDIEAAASIALAYYDKSYRKSIDQIYADGKKRLLSAGYDDIETLADKVTAEGERLTP